MREKYEEITEAIRENFRVGENLIICEETEIEEAQNFREMMGQLKDRAKTATLMNKHLILSVLPKSWSPHKVQHEFDVSYHLAQRVKQVVADCGILSMPPPRSGKKLEDSTIELIDRFYNSDDISRIQPGMRDFVTVRVDGIKTTVTKYIFPTVSEIYRIIN